MALTEAAPPSEADPSQTPSFFKYWQRYQSGDISRNQLLLIPRLPEILETKVDNPEEFSTTIDKQVLPGSSMLYKPDIGFVDYANRARQIDEHSFRQFMPTIETIFEDASSRGVDPLEHTIHVTLKQGPASEQATQQLLGPHLDETFGEQKTKLIYIATDYRPTKFLEGVFDAGVDPNIDQALRLQRDRAKPHSPEPYEIAVFDSAVPHEAPEELTQDTHQRTLLRVWISTKNVYDEHLLDADNAS